LPDGFDAGANRLGALALRVTDRMQTALTDGGARSESSAAALSAIFQFLESPSIDQLSQVLGLSSSATVRLIDGLVADGLVTRTRASDGRVSAVVLTSRGRRRAKAITGARAAVLDDVLAPLSPTERARFDRLVDKVLIGSVRGPRTKGWICRLCDTAVCGAEGRGQPCPVTRAALDTGHDEKGS
jgi:DNA-binding MarR family transcriptional regulator